MNKRGKDSQENTHPNRQHDISQDEHLEARITHYLHAQAQRVCVTPELHLRLRTIPFRQRRRAVQRTTMTVLVLAITLLLLGGGIATCVIATRTSSPSSQGITYTMQKTISVAEPLAHGGQILSLDPTEHYFVYQPAHQSGIIYTSSIADPQQSNTLAMRDAYDMAWSSNGSALVATILSGANNHPLLALVPTGQYMHLLGYPALAASWSPRNDQTIMYVAQTGGQTQMWQTSADGTTATKLMTMKRPLLVQHMIWSPNGHYLALVIGSIGTLTRDTLSEPAHTIYVINTQKHTSQHIVEPGDFTLGKVAWSPDSHNITFERTDPQGHTLVQNVNISNPTQRFQIVPHHQLEGWSWSPESNAIVYSDGGSLQAHVLSGHPITFAQQNNESVTPFWLKDGSILCVQIVQGIGKLTYLTGKQQTAH